MLENPFLNEHGVTGATDILEPLFLEFHLYLLSFSFYIDIYIYIYNFFSLS